MAKQLKPMQAVQRSTRSPARPAARRPDHWRRRFTLLALLLLIFQSACAPTAYWVPPSAPGALPPLAVAASTQLQQVDRTPAPVSTTPAVVSPTPNADTPTVASPVTTVLNPTDPATSEVAVTATTDEATATAAPPSATPTLPLINTTPILYYVQAADTLRTVAVRFGVTPQEITSPDPIPEKTFLTPGQLLLIPRRILNTTSPQHLLPDSEVVFSPSTTDFDTISFVTQAGGKLSTYSEWHKSTGIEPGAQTLLRVATENSINPRLLLALLEYHSGWVFGPGDPALADYPMGMKDEKEKGLYNQLVWAVNQLSIGYYAWREGRLTTIAFPDGVSARLAPDLNAGSAALQYFFAQSRQGQAWLDALDPQSGFPAFYQNLFGNPWERAQRVEPLFPPGIVQPALILPFTRDFTWSFTGGPHGAWERDGAYAALDFAPGSSEPGCVESLAYATASASGLVVRSGNGVVALDLDGDGYEQTGWVLVYLHVSKTQRVPVGTWVGTGDLLGHPSCEGGFSTGTHLHLTRKYNGEWMPADGPLPFNLGGWVSVLGDKAYDGTLVRDGQTITASPLSVASSFIRRNQDDP